MKTPCVVLLLIMLCSPATAEEFSSGPSPAERALLATLEPLQTRKTQLEVRLGGLESRQKSTRDLAEVISLQKETDQLVLELDDLIRQIQALGTQVAKLKEKGLLGESEEEIAEQDEVDDEMVLVDLIDGQGDVIASREGLKDLAEDDIEQLVFLAEDAISLDELGGLTQGIGDQEVIVEVIEITEITEDENVQVGDTREYIDEEGNIVTETVIEVYEEDEYYNDEEWYFADADADYLQRVRDQIAYNKDEISNYEESQIKQGLSVAVGKVQKYRQDAAALAEGISSFAQGLNEFQQQMYEQDQRIAEQRKANERKQKELRDSILAASAARDKTAAASRSQLGQGPYPIIDPYSTPARNPEAYANATHTSKPQLQVQDQPKPSQARPIGKGFSISSNSDSSSPSEGKSTEVLADKVEQETALVRRWSIDEPGRAQYWGVSYGWAWEKPCPNERREEAYSINSQNVYVRDAEKLNNWLKAFTEPDWAEENPDVNPGFSLVLDRELDKYDYEYFCMGNGLL